MTSRVLVKPVDHLSDEEVDLELTSHYLKYSNEGLVDIRFHDSEESRSGFYEKARDILKLYRALGASYEHHS